MAAMESNAKASCEDNVDYSEAETGELAITTRISESARVNGAIRPSACPLALSH